jgi:hypothetical protein
MIIAIIMIMIVLIGFRAIPYCCVFYIYVLHESSRDGLPWGSKCLLRLLHQSNDGTVLSFIYSLGSFQPLPRTVMGALHLNWKTMRFCMCI